MNNNKKLSEYQNENTHAIEITGIVIFTIACIIVCVSLLVRNITIFGVIGLIFAIASIWYIYVTDRFDYTTRVIILSITEGVVIWMYSYWSESYIHVIIPVAVCSVLHILYKNYYCEYVDIFISVITALYHIYYQIISGEFSFRVLAMIIVQFTGLLLLQYLCIYIIRYLKAESEIQNSLIEKLNEAEESKNDFMANMSHELRTPINSILGTSSILLDHPLPDEDKDFLHSLEESGHKLLNVVNDIIDYTMLSSHTLTLNENPYIITSIINDASSYVNSKNKNKNVSVFFDVDPTIPSSLYGDCEKISNIINILIDNAIKFTHAGSIELSISYRKLEYGINLLIKVTDTGIGMEKRELEHLRNGLYMADAKSARRHEGAGLGLSVATGLLSLMEGFLIIDSSYGKGSEFTAVIPQNVLNSAPSVVVEHNNSYKILVYLNPELSNVKNLYNMYEKSIERMISKLNISSVFVRNFAELQSVMGYNNFSHLLLSDAAYLNNKDYFDDLSKKTHLIVITREDSDKALDSEIRKLYLPFYSYHFAELLMHDKDIKPSASQSAVKKFIAPEAKILIVDDNRTNLKVIEGLLKKYQITSILCRSGAEALEKCTSKDYNFIFMDHMMPEMDGIETMKKIREMFEPFYQQVPIIALTANAVGGAREMFLSEGFNDFISKPVNKRELERILLTFIPPNLIKYITEYDTLSSAKSSRKFVIEKTDSDLSDHFYFIDKDNAIALLNNDKEIYDAAVESYINDSEDYLSKLPLYFKTSDWEYYAVIVHAIKSSSQIIGAYELSNIAAELEDASKKKKMDDKIELHNRLLNIYKKIINKLKDNK